MLLIKCSSFFMSGIILSKSLFSVKFAKLQINIIQTLVELLNAVWVQFENNLAKFCGIRLSVDEYWSWNASYPISRHVCNVQPNRIPITAIFHIHHFFRYETENSFIWTKSDTDHISHSLMMLHSRDFSFIVPISISLLSIKHVINFQICAFFFSFAVIQFYGCFVQWNGIFSPANIKLSDYGIILRPFGIFMMEIIAIKCQNVTFMEITMFETFWYVNLEYFQCVTMQKIYQIRHSMEF